ncbi:MAG: hypothetical protein HY568_02505 [Candidatus Latescibacteria bacterium]|nr:hypothetical protein [Candidatus Latescibacterota bacterium]
MNRRPRTAMPRRAAMPPRTARLTALLGIAAALILTAASEVAAHNPKLSSPYVYTIGDDIARRVRGIFRVVAGLEETTLVYYDREHHLIVAEIIGSTDDVEEAKREIAAFVDAIQEGVVGYAKKQHKIDLTDKDITLIYYVDSDQGTPAEVVRREEGRFVIPSEGDDD